MALYLESGWDFGAIGVSKIMVTEGAGTTFTASISTGRYAHTDLSSVMGSGEYTDFASALVTQLEAAGTYQYTVTWSQAAGSYNIDTVTAVNIALQFPNSTAGNNMAHILGFTAASTQVAAGNQASNLDAYYWIASTIGAASAKTDDYEPDTYIEGAIAQDGSHYSVSPTALPVQNDFELRMETHAKTFKRKATAAVPWTYQHFFEHARAAEPFLIADGTDNTVHTLRPKGGSWKGNRVTQDYDGLWNVKFETYMEGRL